MNDAPSSIGRSPNFKQDSLPKPVRACSWLVTMQRLKGCPIPTDRMAATAYSRLKNRAVARPIANAPTMKPHDAEA